MAAPKIIGLYSDVPRSGKTLLADTLCEKYGYVKLSFATPLKETLRAFINSVGVPIDYDDSLANEKETPIAELYGLSLRHLLQTLGTEWGRILINENVWVDSMKLRVESILKTGRSVVIDDMRFLNEKDLIEKICGSTVHITRADHVCDTSVTNHASEGTLAKERFNYYMLNTGVLEDMDYHSEIINDYLETKGETVIG